MIDCIRIVEVSEFLNVMVILYASPPQSLRSKILRLNLVIKIYISAPFEKYLGKKAESSHYNNMLLWNNLAYFEHNLCKRWKNSSHHLVTFFSLPSPHASNSNWILKISHSQKAIKNIIRINGLNKLNEENRIILNMKLIEINIRYHLFSISWIYHFDTLPIN